MPTLLLTRTAAAVSLLASAVLPQIAQAAPASDAAAALRTPPRAAAVAPAAAAGGPSAARVADLREECARHPNEAARQRGWSRSRFEQCHRVYKKLMLHRIEPGRPPIYLGFFRFELVVLAFTHDGDRRADLMISVENARQEQHLANELTYLTIDHHACADHPHLTCTGPLRREDTIGGWYANPHMAQITITSPDNTGQDPFKTVTAELRTGFTGEYRDGFTRQEIELRTALTAVRFDNAGPKLGSGKHKGTVLTDHQPALPLSLSDADIDEEARHVDDVLHHTERTFPSLNGKSAPGTSAERPLHRLMDPALKSKNHAASVKICRDVWGESYTADGLECDEYPFQSTYEGSATSTNGNPHNWQGSARPIDGGDNGRGGTALGLFYGRNRILDGDAFRVTVQP